MLESEKEGPVFDIHKQYTALQRCRKCLFDKAKTALLSQFCISGMREHMVKNGFNFFHIVIITSLTVGLLTAFAGCGYKKPPYYPHKTHDKQKAQEDRE